MNPLHPTTFPDFAEEARHWVRASSAGLSAEQERAGLSRLEQLPLEILPAGIALESHALASRFAMKHASSARALLLARNYREFAKRMDSGLDAAVAAFHEAVALRRNNQFEDAEKLHFESLKKLDQLGADNRAALQARVDLALDQAILAFQREDYLESARMNLKASGFALALGNFELQSRAFLNASISWERLKELENTRQALAQGKESLQRLNDDNGKSSPIRASFALFEWRFQIDHGPFPAAFDRDALDLNHSQETLFRLYDWEYALLTRSGRAIEAAQIAFADHTRQIRNQQFSAEANQLSAVTEFVLKGTGAVPSPEKLLSQPGTIEGQRACLAGWTAELFIRRQWKKLELLAQALGSESHPVLQAAALRASAWLQIKRQDVARAQGLLENALKLATENHLNAPAAAIKDDLTLLRGQSPSNSPDQPPRQSEIRTALRALLPDHTYRTLLVTEKKRQELTDSAEAASITGALAAQELLSWDGACGILHTGKRNEIRLDEKPILRRLLTAVFSSHPNAISKEDLVPLVWEEAYNPLVHDTLIHGAVSRLRRLLPRSHQAELGWDSLGLKWNGSRPFAAWMPIRGTTRTLADDSKLTSRQIRILTLLKYRGSVSKGDVMDALKFSERTTVRELAGLVSAKLVLRSGNGRAIRYFPFSG